MNPESPLNHQTPPNDPITGLINEHSENMLILAYTLTHNPSRANQIVANILLDLTFQDDLGEVPVPLHTWLYTLVKEACKTHILSIK